MNKQTLIWVLIVAVPVGLAAVATGIIYRDTGKLPFQDAVEKGVSTAEKGGVAPAGADGAGKGTPETADAGAAEEDGTEAPAALNGPSFDVVGIEPTGETVVAGRSRAGAMVAMTANGKVVGKSIANEAGEWTIILDEPLKPGDYDVGLEVHDEAGKSIEKSDQRLAVSVPEGGKQKPLVVLNTPDGPSDILQKPEGELEVAAADGKSANGTGTPVAAADEAPAGDGAVTSGEEKVAETSGGDTPAKSETENAQQTASAPEASGTGAASADAPAEGKGDMQVAAEAVAAASEETGPATAATPAAGDPGQDAAATGSGAEPAPAGGTAGAETEVAASAAEGSAAPSASEAGAAPTVTVEAVESEQDKVYVAGTGEPGKSVRVYVGEEYQGEAVVDGSGKWLVQGTSNVPEGNVEVRADVIGEDGNSVDERAAVTFAKQEDEQIVLTKVVASGSGGSKDSQGAEVQKSLPVVIIRKGDNLWRISRRLYGDGVRYTTIYQANQDQIRNPDLIYPGQVFLTPEGDLNWKPQANEPG